MLPRLLLSALWTLVPAFGGEGRGGLVPNGDFERGLDGWRLTGQSVFAALDRPPGAHGACLRLAPRSGLVGVELEHLLRDGVEVDLLDTWELSVRIRTGRITGGAFNALLYCYGPDGRYVAMKSFYTAGAPHAGADWQSVRLVFGPDGDWSPPAETAQIKIRFSFWSEDGRCNGAAWVDDVRLIRRAGSELDRRSTGPHHQPDSVAVWDDPAVCGAPVAGLEFFAEFARKQGLAAIKLSTRELCDPEILTPARFTLLILPYGPAFPARGKTALLRYLRRGGDLIAVGGAAFETPLIEVDGRWGTPADFLAPEIAAKIADFERGLPAGLLRDHRVEGASGSARHIEPGANGSRGALQYMSPDTATFEYVGLPVTAPSPVDTALVFDAGGIGERPWLCVEAQERNGSRWKAVVRLSTTSKWERFVLHASDFFAYAASPKDRGARFRPERTARLYFGLTRKMNGPGKHGFILDNVGWVRCRLAVDDRERRNGLAPVGFLEALYFGGKLIEGANLGGPWTLFDPSGWAHEADAFELVYGRPTDDDLGQFLRFESLQRFRAPGERPRIDGRKRTGPHILPAGFKRQPLLRASDVEAGALFTWTRWPFRGATCAFLGGESPELTQGVLRRLGPALFDIVTRGPAIAGVRPVFGVEDDQCTMAGRITVLNNAGRSASVHVRCSRRDADGKRTVGTSRLTVAPEGVGAVDVSLGLSGPPGSPYRFDAAVEGENARKGSVQSSVDPGRTFRDLADWFVGRQRDDGKFSGISFIDSRAARGLFAAFELFHRETYRRAALRWVDAMVEAQRGDGGYRMGYADAQGVCYVADGGEIALGVVRALRYADTARRKRYRLSLEAYMRFRESFRNDTGDIGVGWCLRDYIANKPFDRLTREMRGRPFTLGCTLGAAAAVSALDEKYARQTVRDARRFMAGQRLTPGVFAEALMWTRHFTDNPALRREIEARLRQSLLEFTKDDARPWWTGSGGRHVVTLAVLAYVRKIAGRDPHLLAALKRVEWALCAAASPYALMRVARRNTLEHDDWIYLCYSLVSLPELLEAGITLRPLGTATGNRGAVPP
ncbi:MAG: hypothetical protein GXP31_18630 [Kiritimatiellaeota bacterium]|nr:hypothetical protein [Kiritimatiellota bacterium]